MFKAAPPRRVERCAAAAIGVVWVALAATGCYRGWDGADAAGADDVPPHEGGATSTTGADQGGGQDTDGETQGADPDGCDGASMGLSPLRRLTRTQYEHAIRDVFSVDVSDVDLPTDGNVGLISSNATFHVASDAARAYMVAAETVADRVDLDSLDACVATARDDVTLQRPCAEALVDGVVGLALRGMLSDELRPALLRAFDEEVADGGFDPALRSMLALTLQLPDFLYVVEQGDVNADSDGAVPLSGNEVASRLSLMLWSSIPDRDLLGAAADGDLATPEGIEQQARRLLADPRAQDALALFHTAWLTAQIRVDAKSPEAFPQFDESLVAALAEERRRFVSDVVSGGGTFEDLLTARFTYVNDELAQFYGIEGLPDSPDTWHRVDLVDGRRQGILTQGGVLAAHAAPSTTPVIKRGRFLLEDVVCGDPPPFPDDFIPEDPPVGDPSMSPRELWEQVHTVGDCAACHNVLDPMGWAFDNFDAIGQWRDEVGGWPVDAAASWQGIEFDGPIELTERLSQRDDARDCYARHWLTFATERAVGADECRASALFEQFAASGGGIEDLLVAIATSDMFRHLELEQ